MHKLRIDLKQTRDDSYDIIIGEGLLDNASKYIAPLLGNNHAIIISDKNTAKLYLKRLKDSLLEANVKCEEVIIEGGEQAKSIEQYNKMVNKILENLIERQTTLIALGGGVIGDLCGFLAATLMRGIPFIQIPTTLLAQVDSAVGGKTGVNAKTDMKTIADALIMTIGKNMIGAFYQPSLVLADTSLLQTLPERQLRAGYAEIVKYALINDAEFFDWLEEHGESIVNKPFNSEAVSYAVKKSCAHKAAIVAKDEKEGGIRALLNLGHTFGHALEALRENDDDLLHGEAVAIGLDLAFRLSYNLELCKIEDVERVQAHLKKTGLYMAPDKVLPNSERESLPDILMAMMKIDKKSQLGNLRLILARGIGRAFIRDMDSNETPLIMSTIREYFND